jgi:multidrug efflux pump subunit AcrB
MAWVFTLLTALSCWLLLPVAIVFTRKARREAESAPELYRWSARNPLNHPVLLFVAVTFLSVGLLVGMQVLMPVGP